MGLGFVDEESTTTLGTSSDTIMGAGHSPCSMGSSVRDVDAAYPHEQATSACGVTTPAAPSSWTPWWATDAWATASTSGSAITRTAALTAAHRAREQRGERDRRRCANPRLARALLEPNARAGVQSAADSSVRSAKTAAVLRCERQVIESVTVYRTAVMDSQGFTVLVPPPRAGWSSVRIEGGAARLLGAVSVPAPRPR